MNKQTPAGKTTRKSKATLLPDSVSQPKPRIRKAPLKATSPSTHLPESGAATIPEGMAAATPSPSTPSPTAGSGSGLNPDSASTPSPTKQSRLISLLQQPGGASLEEIMKATGWQAHSVRGVISGILRRKLKLAVSYDEWNESGKRRYKITGQEGAA